MASIVCLPPTSSSNLKVFFGFQNFKKIVVAAIDTTAEAISGNSGPRCVAVKYCTTAKLNPATKSAGQVSFTPLKPSIRNTKKNGTKSDSGGSICPATDEISIAGTPTTPAIAIIGIPTAPNATGAVFAIKHNPAA